jgi:hypothetical protein
MSQKLQVAVAGIGRMGMDLPLEDRKIFWQMQLTLLNSNC